jgi:hypothetical protein
LFRARTCITCASSHTDTLTFSLSYNTHPNRRTRLHISDHITLGRYGAATEREITPTKPSQLTPTRMSSHVFQLPTVISYTRACKMCPTGDYTRRQAVSLSPSLAQRMPTYIGIHCIFFRQNSLHHSWGSFQPRASLFGVPLLQLSLDLEQGAAQKHLR